MDWRLPENRREAFQRFYSFHLRHQAHPGMVYSFLPVLAEEYPDREWIVWLNGNTQNPATTLLLLQAAPTSSSWRKAVDFWNDNFKKLEWDTDRRHQKGKFGEATELWVAMRDQDRWFGEWEDAWRYARDHPYMGRLSGWSMLEYARILFGPEVPDASTLLLRDRSGSRSHRNGLGVVAGYRGAEYWDADFPELLGIVEELEDLGEDLLEEARSRNPGHPDVLRLTFESALCTYKSWHKPNRRYPGVYADMAYDRLRKAESRFGPRFDLLWEARRDLPDELRMECNPHDPGVSPLKQNHYLKTGEIPSLSREWPDMHCSLDVEIDLGLTPERKERWGS